MHIKGLGRVNKKISTIIGNYQKSNFEKFIRKRNFRDLLRNKVQLQNSINIELVTFTESKTFSDLLLSILSFITSVGLPYRWTVYADDEFTQDQKAILDEFKFLLYQDWFTNVEEEDKKKFKDKWQLRKYLSFSTHPLAGTTIFLDADVLFYKSFNKYIQFIKESNWYLPEPTDGFSIDFEIVAREEYKADMFIINSGFLILNHMPPWNLGMGYLSECLATNSITHFTEQSAVNIAYVNDSFAKILEPRVFHVSSVDHFKIGVLKTDNLAIRHYVSIIRNKMWQSGWKHFI